jgi:hypothetical protein
LDNKKEFEKITGKKFSELLTRCLSIFCETVKKFLEKRFEWKVSSKNFWVFKKKQNGYYLTK